MRLSPLPVTATVLFLIGCGSTSSMPAMPGHDHGSMMQQGTDMGKYLPSDTIDAKTVPEAKDPSIMEIKNGDTIDLSPMVVKKKINGKEQVMFGYNGQIPGPLLKATQGSTFYVNVTNKIPLPTTTHWHGLRLDNAFDGMPGISQAEIQPNGTFRYTVKVPDSGLYWYHPHVREDIEQDLGLYGNIMVTPKKQEKVPADKEEVLILDDILLNAFGNIVPYGKDGATYVMMGRYGNTQLLNGKTDYALDVSQGDVVRFYLTNTASVRPFRISFENARMKLVASDGGPFQKQEMIDSLIIGPAERYVIDVFFETAGTHNIIHVGNGQPKILGKVMAKENATRVSSYANDFHLLQERKDAIAPVASVEQYLKNEPDHVLRISFEGMNHGTAAGEDGIEWEDTMPMMNAVSNQTSFQWKLVDDKTGKTNMDINWKFAKGTYSKVRIINDKESMQHPMHFHGQHFLVLSVNGKPVENLSWKDTFLLRTGDTADILIYMNNPGTWMFHCHIAEHLQDGMMGMFTVE